MSLPSKKDARLCASVVKEIARAKGITNDPASIGALTVTVARLFNQGLRDRDVLLLEAISIADTPVSSVKRGWLSGELRNMNRGAINLSLDPGDERG